MFAFTTEHSVLFPADMAEAVLSHYFHLSCTCSPQFCACVGVRLCLCVCTIFFYMEKYHPSPAVLFLWHSGSAALVAKSWFNQENFLFLLVLIILEIITNLFFLLPLWEHFFCSRASQRSLNVAKKNLTLNYIWLYASLKTFTYKNIAPYLSSLPEGLTNT